MLNSSLAEELLSLLTSEERAESIVGDLEEEARRHGRAWFWISLGGVAAALFFKAFGCARASTLGLLAAGLVLWFTVYAALRLAGALLGLQPLVADFSASNALPWGTALYLALALILASFCAGLLLGRRTAGSGINSAAPLAMFWSATALVLPVWDCLAGTASAYCALLYLVGLPAFYALPLLAGGACARRRTRRIAQPSAE